MPTTTNDAYLTIAEAAALLKVDPSTIRRWIANGRLPAHRFGERTIRLNRNELTSEKVGVDDRQATDEPDWLPLGAPFRTPTEEEKQQVFEALERSARRSAEIRARGVSFDDPPSWLLIRQDRDSRNRRLPDE